MNFINIIDFPFWGDLFFRMLISCFCGGMIGYERENRNKFAGVRTHIIVCLGACAAMIVSKYGFSDIENYDAARVAAQIVSGIGFLGAGVIFVKDNSISGLTTAAGIWTTSIIGMAFGSGLYGIGMLAAIFVMLIQWILYRNEFLHWKCTLYTLVIVVEDASILEELDSSLQEMDIKHRSFSVSYQQNVLNITIKYLCKNRQERYRLIHYLSEHKKIVSFKLM